YELSYFVRLYCCICADNCYSRLRPRRLSAACRPLATCRGSDLALSPQLPSIHRKKRMGFHCRWIHGNFETRGPLRDLVKGTFGTQGPVSRLKDAISRKSATRSSNATQMLLTERIRFGFAVFFSWRFVNTPYHVKNVAQLDEKLRALRTRFLSQTLTVVV
ncbi:Dual specificity phosphatase, partial [Apiospora arundinis]